jgi:hypothetical protein
MALWGTNLYIVASGVANDEVILNSNNDLMSALFV